MGGNYCYSARRTKTYYYVIKVIAQEVLIISILVQEGLLILIQTSTYSGIATITSLPNSVSSTPFPIGPKQCAAILSCSNRKKNISGRLSLNASIPNGLWTKWRKGLTSLPERPLMGLTTRVLTAPLLLPEKSRVRVT